MANKSKPIPLIGNGQVQEAVEITASWKYSADPSTSPAKITLYGINKDGETDLGDAILNYVAGKYVGSTFTTLVKGDFSHVCYEITTNNKKVKIYDISIHTTVSPKPEAGDTIQSIT